MKPFPTTNILLPPVPPTSPGQPWGPPRVSLSPQFFKPWFLQDTKPVSYLSAIEKVQKEDMVGQGSIYRPSKINLALGEVKRKTESLKNGIPRPRNRGFARRSKWKMFKRLQILASDSPFSTQKTEIPGWMDPVKVDGFAGVSDMWKGRNEMGMMISGLGAASKRTFITVGIGAIAGLVGYGLWQNYKNAQAEKERLEGERQKQLGIAIVAKAKGDEQERLGNQILAEAQRAREQEAKGKAIQIQAQLDYQAKIATQNEARIITEAEKKGVSVTAGELREGVKREKMNTMMMIIGGIALVGGLFFWQKG